jgi:hypothetical protein
LDQHTVRNGRRALERTSEKARKKRKKTRPPIPRALTSRKQQNKRHKTNQGTGFDIVALSDASPDYPNSCGTCYAVACRRAVVEDGFGEKLDRQDTCVDESRRVIVTVTDTCPCVYPANAMSNKRWCCGDKPHVDLSTEAFRKLGDVSQGVMAARWKRVPCPSEPTYKDWEGDHPKKQGGGGGSRRMLTGAPAPWAL